MTDTQLHYILLIVSVVCITFLVYVSLQHGGDGTALASGIGAVAAVGGFGLGKLSNGNPPATPPAGQQ